MQFFKQSKFTRIVTLLILGFALLAIASGANASLVVIANPSIKLNKLSKSDLADLYLSKPISLGQNVQPYNQPDNSLAYQQFYQSILGWTPSRVSSYWTPLVFSGQASPPPVVNNDAAAIRTVEQTPGAIAYVDSSSLADVNVGAQVKILYGHYKPPVTHRPAKLYSSSSTSGYMTSLSAQNNPTYTKPASTDPDASLAAQLTSINSAQTGANLWPIISSHMTMEGQANNPAVRHWILWFEMHRKTLNMMIDNATPYLYYIYNQTQTHHMPAEFTLLPMIESGYEPKAYSYAGAAGLWQLMPGTASSYGLAINWWYDSRLDILSSTNSALTFLSELHKELGTWNLAAAAYNVGPGALHAAIVRNREEGKPTDFWNLTLPKQTENYVPKLLALSAIIKDPSHYGVTLPYVPNSPFFGAITLTSQMDLKEISTLSAVSIPILKELNPGLRRFATAPNSKFTLLLPVTAVNTLKQNLQKVIGKRHISWKYHEARAPETLAVIAKNYRTSVSVLKKVNHLSSNHLYSGQGILVPVQLHKVYTNVGRVSGIAAAPQNRSTQETMNNALKRAAETQSEPIPKEVTGQPIKSTDSLQTLLGKLYGSD